MRTQTQIQDMFDTMGLGTEEKRSRFKFSFGYAPDQEPCEIINYGFDTKTKELGVREDAELERDP